MSEQPNGDRPWEGKPLRWTSRPFWCKIGFHSWGYILCPDCGYKDEILLDAFKSVLNPTKSKAKEAEDAE